MTDEQQSIIALFNTKQLYNIEIAQECAISTGNAKWFYRYINKIIVTIIRKLREHDAFDICVYYGENSSAIIISEKEAFRFLASSLIFWGCYMEVFPDRGKDTGYAYVATIMKKDNDDYIEINFDWSGFDLVEKLRAQSIIFDIFYH